MYDFTEEGVKAALNALLAPDAPVRLAHPLGGADHLLAMISLGLLAAERGGRATWALPAGFVGAMLAGGALGAAGVPLPAVEPAILASAIVIGAMVAGALRPPLAATLAGAALFGLAHGWAHGAEAMDTAALSALPSGKVAHVASVAAAGLTERVLAGRDLRSGGSWVGLGLDGRAAVVTNVRDPLVTASGRSRGHLIADYLSGSADAATYARELAPLAGHYPALKLGPSWWFHDSPEGMRRFREQVTETAGFYNTVGFNDDTRAFPSIPARHDIARRVDCAFLARLVCDHRLREDEAFELARELTVDLPRNAYKFDRPD